MVDRDSQGLRLALASALAAIFVALISAGPASPADRPTTTPEIIELLQGELSEDIIVRKIAADGCECAVSPELIKGLQTAGASEDLIRQLIGISAGVYPENPMTTPVILEMLEVEISEEIIWQSVVAAGCQCDTSAQSLISLKRSGASDELMANLIEVSARAATEIEPPR